jgi:hypothetical protein
LVEVTATDPQHEPQLEQAQPEGSRPDTAPEGATPGSDELSQRLATQIEHDVETPLPWWSIAKKVIVALVAGIAIYLAFPSLVAVFGSWPKLASLQPIWFGFAVIAEAAHFGCTIWLQRIALRSKAWFSVATSQLAGNAISLVVPGGAAFGAATQFRMLAAAGNDTATAVGGLTAFSLLGIAGLLALPVFLLPAILFSIPVDRSLQHAALLGVAGFVLFAGFGAAVLFMDAPMRWAGRVVQRVRNRLKRKSEPMTGLEDRLVFERNRIRDVLGEKWRAALLLSSGRIAFDYTALLFALRATGARPQPALVLLAYAVQGILRLVPITPGGLGIVEAGLSGMLILAGVPGGEAVLATLAYRIISYWLPIFVGPFAYLAFRLRYGAPGRDEGGGTGTGTALATG